MNKKIMLMVICFLLLIMNANAQHGVKRLRVGDKVPDIEFLNMINYSGGKAKLSDFKGKLIVLDFWNILCIPCIKAFPKMEEIQKHFDGKVQIILVNSFNVLDDIKAKFGFPEKSRASIIRNAKLPFAFEMKDMSESKNLENTTLFNYFPHSSEPFHVWIDQDGIVKALSDGRTTTIESIQNFFEGKEPEVLSLPYAGDLEVGQYESAVQSRQEIVLNNIGYSSFFIKGIPSTKAKPDIYDSLTSKIIGFRRAGLSPMQFFKDAYIYYSFPDNRVILNVKNSKQFTEPDPSKSEWNKWVKEYYAYYEVKMPEWRLTGTFRENMILLYKIYRQDLERYYGVTGKMEKKKVKCLILIKKGNVVNTSKYHTSMDLFTQYFKTINDFINEYNYKNPQGLPIVNETGFDEEKYLLSIIIDSSLSDLDKVKVELSNYGYDLIVGERELEMLVLSDSK